MLSEYVSCCLACGCIHSFLFGDDALQGAAGAAAQATPTDDEGDELCPHCLTKKTWQSAYPV